MRTLFSCLSPLALALLFHACDGSPSAGIAGAPARDSLAKQDSVAAPEAVQPAMLDTALYNQQLMHLVHDSASARWPVKTEYPLAGAILPFKRIIAYYGNFYSKRMGILGALPPDEMLARLDEEVAAWEKADSTTPVIPAIHYIAVTAQSQPGKGGKYRLRMPFSQIEKALEIAEKRDALVFLDIQVGHSTLSQELPELDTFLRMPHVHLAIDPEFSMKDGSRPGARVGYYTAEDINYATEYLAKLVREHQLPPKILVVHRFTDGMVKNTSDIQTRPEVQIVIHMDGFGFPAKKRNSYLVAVVNRPVQFGGFKIFYVNDAQRSPGNRVMRPEEVLTLYPKPIYIQYQ